MPFYKGKSADGSDAEEIEGAYINPNNPDEFSSRPYPEHIRIMNKQTAVYKYMDGKYTLRDIYNQIKAKTCGLSASLREYVLSHFDENGVFLYNKEVAENSISDPTS